MKECNGPAHKDKEEGQDPEESDKAVTIYKKGRDEDTIDEGVLQAALTSLKLW